MARKAAPGRIMDSRRKLQFRTTSKTLRAGAAEVVTNRPIRTRTHQRMLQVTAAEVGEDFLISPAFRVNSPFSAVPGSEKERAPKTHFPNPDPMPRRTHLLSHHTAMDRVGLFCQSHAQTNLHPTHHPTHRVTPSHLQEAISLLTTHLHDSSGLAVGVGGIVTLGVDLGMAGLRSHNHNLTEWTRISCRTIVNSDTLASPDAATLELRNSLTLSKGTDSEPVRWASGLAGPWGGQTNPSH